MRIQNCPERLAKAELKSAFADIGEVMICEVDTASRVGESCNKETRYEVVRRNGSQTKKYF